MSPGTAVLFGFGATLGLRYSTLKALNAECSDICCHLSLPFVFTVSEVQYCCSFALALLKVHWNKNVNYLSILNK